ncbi:hypothetical protein NPIL_526041 [Nephila pilipes]|uniref:Uncharacterized protein n=1 Tax=Nephila pilipes TaxID=299642 RepID=A0A8X6PW00_NEPPI|nr:hypothetical protein NPIL_526041 [Nephila pilipes]
MNRRCIIFSVRLFVPKDYSGHEGVDSWISLLNLVSNSDLDDISRDDRIKSSMTHISPLRAPTSEELEMIMSVWGAANSLAMLQNVSCRSDMFARELSPIFVTKREA